MRPELIVAIAGPTCSGKTTLAEELKQTFNPDTFVARLSYDEFDLYPAGSPAAQREAEHSSVINWEDPTLFDNQAYVEALRRLRSGCEVTVGANSRESQVAGVTSRVVEPGNGIVVVDGIFAWHDPAAEALIDLRVFLNLDEQTMIERRLGRTPKDSQDPWDQADYIHSIMVSGTRAFVSPQKRMAHLVLDATQPIPTLVEKIRGRIIAETWKQGPF